MPSYRIMEAPSPGFIANTWDNIIVPSNDEVQCVSVWKRGMELSKGMLFNNKDDLQFAVRAYSIDKNQSYKVSESSMVPPGMQAQEERILGDHNIQWSSHMYK